MGHSIELITLLLAIISAGCTPADGEPTAGPKNPGTAAAQGDKAVPETKEAAKEAAQAVQRYAWAQKSEYIEGMKKELVEIQGELDRLAARVDRANGAAKAEAGSSLEVAREKWAQAKKGLERAEGATESAWDEVKGGFKKSHEELKGSFEKARQHLRDKIDP